jgi:serine/threonine protein kinase/WD40 repeat protein
MSAEQAPNETPAARDPVEELAEEFLNRFRRGERPSVSEFLNRAPEHADEIRELFPALVLMEKAGPVSAPVIRPSRCPPLERLGEFRIIREVGRGGMGIVYEAEQEALGRQVALKVLSASAAGDGHCLLRFRREARAAARLHHTNIVPVFDIGERDGVHFYAMQLIQGQGLDDVIKELRRLRGKRETQTEVVPPSEAKSLAKSLLADQFSADAAEPGNAAESPPSSEPAGAGAKSSSTSVLNESSDFSTKSDLHFYRSVARIGVQVASALAHAHDQRILHRDIKPSNLLLDARGTVWVTDFGLAKDEGEDLTRSGDVVGTLRYMAPERFAGEADSRSDVYSLGLTLYEMLTLRPAFVESDRVRLVQAIAATEPSTPRHFDPQVPRDLETIVLKAINKDLAARYAAARDMEEDLRRFLGDRPIHARRTSTWERLRRWCRRNPGWAATIATVFGLLAILAIVGTSLSWYLRQALNDVQNADADKTEKLYQSYVERARALRTSGRVGQRFRALDAIREAAKIKVTPELRNEAAAALVLADIELDREWEGFPEGTVAWVVDDAFHRFARLDKDGHLTIGQLTADGEENSAQIQVPDQPPFNMLRMSPDGRYLAQGHNARSDGVGGMRLWQIDLPMPKELWDQPDNVILRATCFDDDGRFALATLSGEIHIYNPAAVSPSQRVSIEHLPLNLALQPKGKLIAAACGEAIELLDLETGTLVSSLRLPKIHTWWFGLAWHPAGQLLAASAEDKKIHIWDTATGAEAMDPLEENANGIYMSFSHGGDRLISTSWGGYARLWDTQGGRLLLNLPSLTSPQFSADDRLIGVGRKGALLRLWQLADGRELRTIRRPLAERTETIHHPVLDPQTGVLATASERGLAFFDFESGKELAFAPFKNETLAVPRSFHQPDGWLAGGKIHTTQWPMRRNPDRPEQIHIGPPRVLADSADSGANSSPDGRYHAIPQGRQALWVDRKRPGLLKGFGPQSDVRYSAVSPDGRWVAVCSWSPSGAKNVRVWDAENSGRHVEPLPNEGHAQASFSPDGRWLATYSLDHNCRLWKVGSWEPGPQFDNRCCWSNDGRLLAVHDELGAIRWVEPDSGREVFRLTGPDARTYTAEFLTADYTQLVATVSDLSALYIWDLRLIRHQLKELDLDWDWPEFEPAQEIRHPPLAVTVDTGIVRQRAFDSDKEAVAALSIALALQPINPEAYLQRGLALDRLKLATNAIADYEMFLAQAPSTDRRRPEIHMQLAANYYQSLKDSRKAAAALRDAAAAPADQMPYPGKLAALSNELAWNAVMQLPDAISAETALPLVRKTVDMEPYSFLYQNTLGAVLYRVGQFDEAIRCLEANVPHSGDLVAWDLYFLAMSHHRRGHSTEANRCFETAGESAKSAKSLSEGQRQELAIIRAETAKLFGIQ